MNTLDWNWFFSALPQSAAALIGIIGAFTITRAIDESKKLHSTIERFKSLTSKRSELIKMIKLYDIEECNKDLIYSNEEIIDKLRNGELQNMNEKEVVKFIRDETDVFFKDEAGVLKIVAEMIVLEKNYQHDLSMDDTGTIVPNYRITHDPFLMLGSTKEAIELKKIRIKCDSLVNDFINNKVHLSEIRESLRLLIRVILVLGLSVFVIVIYPLHFLPLNGEAHVSLNPAHIIGFWLTLKGLLLGLFSLIVIVSEYYLIKMILKLFIEANNLGSSSLKKYVDLRYYSEYFNVYRTFKEGKQID